MRLKYYKYGFFLALLIIAALVVCMALLSIGIRNSSLKQKPLSVIMTATSSPAAITQTDQKIESITPKSITVSWKSILDGHTVNQSYAVVASTGVFAEIPKDSATVAKEEADFQAKLHQGAAVSAPFPYTLEPAAYSALRTGMTVHVEFKQTMTDSRTEIMTATRILVGPGQLSTSTAQR